jgi:hypothetical protein
MTTTTEAPATQRQRDYLLGLLGSRDLLASDAMKEAAGSDTQAGMDSYVAIIKPQVDGLGKVRASNMIGHLKALPLKHPAQQKGSFQFGPIKSDVPQGRYAVTGDDGTTDFYRVDRPTEGRWAGHIFVKLGLGGPYGEPRWERIPLRNVQTILDKVAKAGPKEAMLRYGKELGHCGHCGRTLTNPDSIEAGIGPVCRGKMGW